MKLSELINRLEEIKETDGDMDVVIWQPVFGSYLPISPADIFVENVESFKEEYRVSEQVKTDLALFIE